MAATSNPSADGILEEVDGRYVLRFERRLAHPVERVWDALTRPARITQWFGEGDVDLDLVEGGRFHVRTTGPPDLVKAIIAEAGEEALETADTVLKVEPPRVFEHTFGGAPTSIVRWEFRPEGDETVLLLTHTEPEGFEAENAPRDLAGWHVLLDRFSVVLGGEPGDWSLDEWQRERDRYAAFLKR